jgi:hypothetical protein
MRMAEEQSDQEGQDHYSVPFVSENHPALIKFSCLLKVSILADTLPGHSNGLLDAAHAAPDPLKKQQVRVLDLSG